MGDRAPKYRVEHPKREVGRELDRIHEPELSRIAQALLQLQDNAGSPGCRQLRGLERWLIRVGRWRVLCHSDDRHRLVTMVHVRRRREDTYR